MISLLCTSYAPSLSAQDSEAEKSVCEFISKTASELNSSLVFQNLDKDKGSPFVRDYLVQTIIWDADTKGTPKLAEKDDVWAGEHVNYHASHLRWAHDVGFLPYLGNWYKVFAHTDSGANRGAKSTGAYLSAVLGKDGLICAFETNTKEASFPTLENLKRDPIYVENGLDCPKAIDPSNVVRANISLSEDLEEHLISEMGKDFRAGWFKRNAYSKPPYADGKSLPFTDGPVLKIDINNDGIEDTLLRMNYSEASSSPCGTFYYDVLSDDMTGLGDPKLREAVFAAQGMSVRDDGQRRLSCGHSHTVLSVNGRNYISSERKLFRQIFSVENESL